MTSREIAEYTGKRHDNVLVDVHLMLGELHPGGLLEFQETYQHAQNKQTYLQYRLPKRETLILVSGYSVTMRAKIIDRWQELEAQAQAQSVPAIPTTLVGALRLALAQAEELEAKTLQIEAMKPAATVGAMVAMHTPILSPPSTRSTAARS